MKLRSVRLFIAASSAAIIAWCPTWLQPVMLAEFVSHAGMTKSAAGLIITSEMLSIAASSWMFARVGSASLRAIGIIGIVIAAAGHGVALSASSYSWLLAARVLAGLGEGALLTVANAALARFEAPDRAYARLYIVTNITASIVLYSIPFMGHLTGGVGSFPTMIAILVLMLPGVLASPRELGATQSRHAAESSATTRAVSLPILMIGAGMFAYLIVIASSWPSYLVIGMQMGLTAREATHALAVSQLFALVGSFLASIVGTRFGRFLPSVLGIVVVETALFCLTHTKSPLIYRLCISSVMCGGYFVVPYFYGYAAARDRSGRGAAMVGALAPLSFAVGPYLGGTLLERVDIGMIGWLALLAGVTALSLLWRVDRGLKSLVPLPS